MEIEAGRLIGSRFVLERPLARGGMGSVWVAMDTQLGVQVAIKMMAKDCVSSPDLVMRFEREAKAAAQLRSPHVVQIFEHGIDSGLPYMVLELLEGEDLGARLRRRGTLPPDEVASILGQIGKALRRAHAAGIVHRDLKPANIFLSRDDEEDVVKVLDFGIAKVTTADGETKTGMLFGTPHYMSPEQGRRTKEADHRSDLWSLGVILYRMLTGHLPWGGGEALDVLLRITIEPAPPPSQVKPELGTLFDAFFERALAKSPAERFQDVRALVDAFSALVPRPALLSWTGTEGAEGPGSAQLAWPPTPLPASDPSSLSAAPTRARPAPPHLAPQQSPPTVSAILETERGTLTLANVQTSPVQSEPTERRARWKLPALLAASLGLVLTVVLWGVLAPPVPSSTVLGATGSPPGLTGEAAPAAAPQEVGGATTAAAAATASLISSGVAATGSASAPAAPRASSGPLTTVTAKATRPRGAGGSAAPTTTGVNSVVGGSRKF